MSAISSAIVNEKEGVGTQLEENAGDSTEIGTGLSSISLSLEQETIENTRIVIVIYFFIITSINVTYYFVN
ncbi:MAG: hypothetical protein COB15_12860 [Flavobacteriales bacterium]|nr:MAG: hypothetical protein COB15_12860 [Flavobacteriales bacterium]